MTEKPKEIDFAGAEAILGRAEELITTISQARVVLHSVRSAQEQFKYFDTQAKVKQDEIRVLEDNIALNTRKLQELKDSYADAYRNLELNINEESKRLTKAMRDEAEAARQVLEREKEAITAELMVERKKLTDGKNATKIVEDKLKALHDEFAALRTKGWAPVSG